jgi:hypothetical protein
LAKTHIRIQLASPKKKNLLEWKRRQESSKEKSIRDHFVEMAKEIR